MTERQPIPPPEERHTEYENIHSSKQLTISLGLVRNPTEKPQSYYRTFEKPRSQFTVTLGDSPRHINGYQILTFQDVGKFAKEKEERISTGVRIGENPFTRWAINHSVQSLLADERIQSLVPDLNLPSGIIDATCLSKSKLKEGGYTKVLQLIKAADQVGYYEEELEKLQQEMRAQTSAYYERVNNILIPQIEKHFPEYKDVEVDYFELGDAYFYAPPAKGRKNPRTLRLHLAPDNFMIAYKRGSDFYTIHPPFEAMPDDTVQAGWQFEENDSEAMKSTVAQALTVLKTKMPRK